MEIFDPRISIPVEINVKVQVRMATLSSCSAAGMQSFVALCPTDEKTPRTASTPPEFTTPM
jgi:hypothetical protein